MTQFKDKNTGEIIRKCPTPIGHFVTNSKEIKYARCKSWRCPYCSQINKKKLLDRIANGFSSDSYVIGFTLTAPASMSREELQQAWHRLHATFFKNFGHIKYIKITEFSEESHLYYAEKYNRWQWSIGNQRHFHFLTDKIIDWKLLLKWWEKATKNESHRIFIKKYNIRSSAGYVSKYITKFNQQKLFSKSEPRYSFSRKDGFTISNIEEQLRYGFILPKKGEYTFFVGMPKERLDNEEKYRKGDWEGGGISVPKPIKTHNIRKYIKEYLQWSFGLNYIQSNDNLVSWLKWEFETEYKNRYPDIKVEKDYIYFMINEHNKKFGGL